VRPGEPDGWDGFVEPIEPEDDDELDDEEEPWVGAGGALATGAVGALVTGAGRETGALVTGAEVTGADATAGVEADACVTTRGWCVVLRALCLVA
jgi:hypothetical protein